ncbi:MAG: hypothetical protein CL489_10320 [Acidobacteria bacterium]|nr:hypothetical protein [Acidobacteriota bacterium]|tara:strand:+ start:11623 stop:12138 length:516 start_codon:yes stop_codon:yes gene_type:complete
MMKFITGFILTIIVTLFLTFLSGCGPEPGEVVKEDVNGYDITYLGETRQGTKIYCHPNCPPLDKISDRIDKINILFNGHGDEKVKKRLAKNAVVLYSDVEMWLGDRQIFGLTYSSSQRTQIYYPYPCEPKGLCNGIFVYEFGHFYMYHIDPTGTEPEWLEYRQKHNLLEVD